MIHFYELFYDIINIFEIFLEHRHNKRKWNNAEYVKVLQKDGYETQETKSTKKKRKEKV